MNGFKASCPKCGASSVSVHRDKSNGWSTGNRQGIVVLHCRSCGKQLSGAAAETEIDRQIAIWEKLPKPAVATEVVSLNLALDQARQKRQELLNQERRAALAEADAAAAHGAELLQDVLKVKAATSASGFEFRCSMNLVEIVTRGLQRLAVEVREVTSSVEIQKRIGEVRKNALSLPALVKKTIALAEAEAPGRSSIVLVKPTPATVVKPTPPPPRAKSSPEKSPPPVVVPLPPTVRDRCAWKDCTNPPREDSVYCGTDCRIKFARWRYVERGRMLAATKPVKVAKAPVSKKKALKKALKPPVLKKAPNFDAMNLSELRTYASAVLKITGASKIPGGRDALLPICKKAVAKMLKG